MANEVRLIDALPLMQNGWHLVKTGESNRFLKSMSLADVPTVDAVEVVRCAKCKHWNPRYETMGMCMRHNSIVTFTKPEFFCAFGEGKNNGICKED